MKKAFQKSRIPEGKAFVIRELIAPCFDVNWHFHSECQLFLVLKGRGTRFIGDHMQPFKEGDMVFTGPNLPHLWRSDNTYFDSKNGLETHGIVIYFPVNFLGESVFLLEEFEGIARILKTSARGLEISGKTNLLIGKMMKELIALKGGESIIQLLQILNLMVDSPDCEPITQAGYINLNKESETDRMGQVYEYVLKNFKEKIMLEEVAEMANLSVSAFSRYFKTRVNKSFSDFLSDVRISHACKLLHEEEMNISEISFECGFFTLSNFNKQFKDRTGKTPLAFKKDYLATFLK
ncbi:MAG: AraC family transcriptional regulator [Algoriphagus sp.]|nr:AraC family transcriptional regulator [Algoriphagus sp.]